MMINYTDSKKNIKIKPLRPKIEASKQVEVWYRERFEQYIKLIRKKYDDLVHEEITSTSFGDADEKRSNTFSKLFSWLSDINFDLFAENAALGVMRRANARNNKLFEKATKQIQIDPKRIVKGRVQEELNKAVNQNVSLIKNVHQDMLGKLSNLAKDLLFSNKSRQDIGKDFSKVLNTTYERGQFIAKDQAQKINGALTRARAEEIGNDLYVWETGHDGRVRPSHKAMQGKVCKYSDNTIFLNEKTGEWIKRSTIGGVELGPSEDFNCRCMGRLYIKDL